MKKLASLLAAMGLSVAVALPAWAADEKAAAEAAPAAPAAEETADAACKKAGEEKGLKDADLDTYVADCVKQAAEKGGEAMKTEEGKAEEGKAEEAKEEKKEEKKD